MDERERNAAGMTVRRAVLGDAHVDRSLKHRNDFNTEFQDLITRYAWGEIWTRPGLPRHTRSLLTIAMMVALNRGETVTAKRSDKKYIWFGKSSVEETLTYSLDPDLHCTRRLASQAGYERVF